MEHVVVLRGVEIPERLIAEEAQNHPAASAAEARAAAASALAVKALLLGRARELGLEAAPEPLGEGLEESEEEALIRAVLDAEVEPARPTEDELRRVYDARAQGSRPPPFETVRERIRLHLESRAWTAAAAAYVTCLAERARDGGVSLSLRPDGALSRPALTLGGLLAEADRLVPWLDAADPALAARIAEASRAEGVAAAELVRSAVRSFIQDADDEAWTRLVSAAREAEDPALAGLASILKSRLTPKRRSITLIRTV